jgi:hypothetical protein
LYSNVKDWRRLKTTKYEKVDNEDDDDDDVENGDQQQTVTTKQEFIDDINNNNSNTNQESEFNIDNKQKSSNKIKDTKKKNTNYVDLLLNKNDIIECLTEVSQQSLVPMFFSLMAIILTYLVIGLTSCFDSIRTNCLMLSK